MKLYTHVKYSKYPNGKDMQDIPFDSKTRFYVGIAFNQSSPTESTNPKDYEWDSKYFGRHILNKI